MKQRGKAQTMEEECLSSSLVGLLKLRMADAYILEWNDRMC